MLMEKSWLYHANAAAGDGAAAGAAATAAGAPAAVLPVAATAAEAPGVVTSHYQALPGHYQLLNCCSLLVSYLTPGN